MRDFIHNHSIAAALFGGIAMLLYGYFGESRINDSSAMHSYLLGATLLVAAVLQVGVAPSPRQWIIGISLAMMAWLVAFYFLERRKQKDLNK